jgi:hypothetical protein
MLRSIRATGRWRHRAQADGGEVGVMRRLELAAIGEFDPARQAAERRGICR